MCYYCDQPLNEFLVHAAHVDSEVHRGLRIVRATLARRGLPVHERQDDALAAAFAALEDAHRFLAARSAGLQDSADAHVAENQARHPGADQHTPAFRPRFPGGEECRCAICMRQAPEGSRT